MLVGVEANARADAGKPLNYRFDAQGAGLGRLGLGAAWSDTCTLAGPMGRTAHAR